MTALPSMETGIRTLRIDAHVDVVCPWCFIGLRRLKAALSLHEGARLDLRWHPYFLNRDIPDRTPEFRPYMERKVGGTLRLQRLLQTLTELGETLKIDFDFDAIPCVPNTLNAHKLVRLAHTQGMQTEILDALFTAYFCEGQDIGDTKTLFTLAQRFGFTEDEIYLLLQDKGLSQQILTEVEATHQTGTTGIPLFVFQHRFQITGAHDPEVLARMLDVSAMFNDFDLSINSPPGSPQSPLATA